MDREGSLAGQTAIITGASAGIGRAVAHTLADAGANVVLAARREDRLAEIADTITAQTAADSLVVPTDVSDEAAVEHLIETSVDTFGQLDIVVNNAGTGIEPGLNVDDVPTEQYRTMMGVNVDGMFFVTRKALPYLRDSNGIAIFVSSFAGAYPRPRAPVYAASKWWTRGFALSLAGHVGDDDVGVTLINPTEVRTEFGKDFREEDELMKERLEPGSVTEPEEVAAAVRFAASQDSPNAVTELDLYRRDKFSDW